MGGQVKDLFVYYNDMEWIIASSPEDAFCVLEEMGAGFTEGERSDPDYWVKCDPNRIWTCTERDGSEETKTYKEWVIEKGRGYLGIED